MGEVLVVTVLARRAQAAVLLVVLVGGWWCSRDSGQCGGTGGRRGSGTAVWVSGVGVTAGARLVRVSGTGGAGGAGGVGGCGRYQQASVVLVVPGVQVR